MLGYLNAPSPFEADGWYDTRDLVEERNGSFRITGRAADVINVAGLKFMPAEVERVALQFPSVVFATAYARANPITGQHVELVVEPRSESAVDLVELKAFLAERLLPHMVPRRIRVEAINVGHRFKKGPL
jgi:acyl-coenzyme A synthetase/AMP-(fatty) acid ligase